jgi:F0F1-type ATP synthase delta subunit
VALEHKAPAAAPKLTLPVLIFGVAELHRLTRELEALEDYFKQSSLRTPGTQPQLPKVSRTLEALGLENKSNLLVAKDRQVLAMFLGKVNESAPRVHISFATDPSAAFVGKIVQWFRSTVHPAILVQVGLQPTIAAGCVVRTPNKQFDFSLRQRFDAQSILLGQELNREEPAKEPVKETVS